MSVKTTIILPFYNKLERFSHSLPFNRGVFERDDVELLISLDTTNEREELVALLSQLPIRSRVIANSKPHPWRNPSAAINVGIRHANGDWILVLSPETVITPGSFEALQSLAEKERTPGAQSGVAVFGYVRFLIDGQAIETAAPLHPYGSFYFSKADAFAIGGYNERFDGWGGDDLDFRTRLELFGVKLRDSRSALFIHYESEAEYRQRTSEGKTVDPARHAQILRYGRKDIVQADFGRDFDEVVYDSTLR